MDIYFLGLTAVRLRGKKTTLVVDPFNREKTGTLPVGRRVKFDKTEADAVLLTSKNARETSLSQVQNYRVIVDGPGEYEVGGVSIIGLPVGETTTYYIKMDGVALLHLGALQKPLSESEFEKYPNIDVVFVPASLGKDAADMVAKLEPKVVVPIHFDDNLTLFLKELGKSDVKPQSRLSITKDKLPQELEVAWLS